MSKVEDVAGKLCLVSYKIARVFEDIDETIEYLKNTDKELYRELNSKHGYEIFEKYRKMISSRVIKLE